MPLQNLQNVSVVVAEPRSEMGDVLNAALYPLGLRNIVVCRDANGLRDSLDAGQVDVLLCDVELSGLDFREAMQKIRHYELGHNPFVHIVAMIGTGGRDLIQRLLGAGVDDLIRKPMTSSRLVGRFENLVRPRKPFEVGPSYVGPNRRKMSRPGDGYTLVEVPNSLRSKSLDNMHPTQVQEAIENCWLDIEERSSRSSRDAIGTLTKRIIGFYDGTGSEAELRRDLRYLIAKSEELITRHRHNPETLHVAEVAACMTGVARRIFKTPSLAAPTDIKLMPHLAGATRLSAASPEGSVEDVREIVTLIRDYLRAR